MIRGVLALVVLALLAQGCARRVRVERPVGAPGKWYLVEEGETLADIARRVGVPEEDLLEINGLRSAAEVHKGKFIFVLDPPRPEDRTPQPPSRETALAERGGGSGAGQPRFRWPVDFPRVTSLFGKRWGRPHEGIDLTAPIGTPVLAAGGGEVVYAGNAVRGYGNMVVLKHEDEFMTVYAHNSVLYVRVGDRVRVGQRVALSGQSGHATGPHVHFEVRKGEVPHDPLPFLPEIRPPRIARERTPKS